MIAFIKKQLLRSLAMSLIATILNCQEGFTYTAAFSWRNVLCRFILYFLIFLLVNILFEVIALKIHKHNTK